MSSVQMSSKRRNSKDNPIGDAPSNKRREKDTVSSRQSRNRVNAAVAKTVEQFIANRTRETAVQPPNETTK